MFAEYLVRASRDEIRQAVEEAAEANGLRMSWTGPDDGVAGKGTTAGNFWGGAFAQRYRMPVTIRPHPDGLLLRVDKGDSGLLGGFVGAARVRWRHRDVCAALEAQFQAQGVLLRQHRE